MRFLMFFNHTNKTQNLNLKFQTLDLYLNIKELYNFRKISILQKIVAFFISIIIKYHIMIKNMYCTFNINKERYL